MRVFLLMFLFLMLSCEQKPSDSNFGRVTQEDGFAVKDFMTAESLRFSKEIKKNVRFVMMDTGMSETSSTSWGDKKEVVYMTDNDSAMIKSFKKHGTITKVYIEGPKEFVKECVGEHRDQFKIQSLYNARKVFLSDPIDIRSIVDKYIREHGLKASGITLSLGEDKEEEATLGEKRILKDFSENSLTVFVEGDRPFVDGLREKLKGFD